MLSASAIALLMLGGVGLMSLISFSENDEDDSLDTSDEPEAGKALTVDGETVIGTEGGDTFIDDTGKAVIDGVTVSLKVLDLGAGDDYAELDFIFGGEIYGGTGDDTIIHHGVDALIYAGDGDDTIVAGSGDAVYGGEGNDTITYVNTNAYFDSPQAIRGETGNDTFSLELTIGADEDPFDNFNQEPRFLGGEGADTFELTLDLVDYGGEKPSEPLSGHILTLRDFAAGEDVLIIDVQRVAGEMGRALVSTEFSEGTDRSGETYTDVTLTFAGTDSEPELSASIRLYDSNVSSSDIVLQNA